MAYIINKNTLFVYQDNTKININEDGIIINLKHTSLTEILEESCKYYGSSFKGRIEGSKNLINCKYKLPIMISEKNNILFFPVIGAKKNENIWFNFNMIKEYKKDGDFVLIKFKNNYEQKFMISYTIFNNQMLKSSRLWFVYSSRE